MDQGSGIVQLALGSQDKVGPTQESRESWARDLGHSQADGGKSPFESQESVETVPAERNSRSEAAVVTNDVNTRQLITDVGRRC